MNLERIEQSLPNGFHDAILNRLDIDYVQSVAKLSIEIWVDLRQPLSPRSGRDPVMRRAELTLHELVYFAIDPPCHLVPTNDGVSVTGADARAENNGLPTTPPGVFTFSFFACDWNAYLHVAARRAHLDWKESEEEARLRC